MAESQTPEDGDVVEAVLAGETDLYRVLVRRYQEPLFRHAMRMVGREDPAAELVQRAFIKGFRKLRTCRNPDRVGGWLYRITSNLCKDYLKDRRRDELPLEDAPPLSAETGNPGNEMERSEMRSDIEAALGRLSADQREAFLLKHVEGRSYTEMSEMLEVSVSALKMRVHRARDELRSLLEDYA